MARARRQRAARAPKQKTGYKPPPADDATPTPPPNEPFGPARNAFAPPYYPTFNTFGPMGDPPPRVSNPSAIPAANTFAPDDSGQPPAGAQPPTGYQAGQPTANMPPAGPDAAVDTGPPAGYARGGAVNGDMDRKASVLAGLRKRYDAHIGMAQGAMAHGDLNAAMHLASKAHDQVPDGHDLSFARTPQGNVHATARHARSGVTSTHAMSPDQFHRYLIGPATSFDHVIDNGVHKNLAIASGRGAALSSPPAAPDDPIHHVRQVLQHTRQMHGLHRIGQSAPRVGYQEGGEVRGYDDGGEVTPRRYAPTDEELEPQQPEPIVPAAPAVPQTPSGFAPTDEEMAPARADESIGSLGLTAVDRFLGRSVAGIDKFAEEQRDRAAASPRIKSLPEAYGSMKQALADYINGTNATPAAETERVVQAAEGATPGEKSVNAVLNPVPAAEIPAAARPTGYAAAGDLSPDYLDAAGGQALAGQAPAPAATGYSAAPAQQAQELLSISHPQPATKRQDANQQLERDLSRMERDPYWRQNEAERQAISAELRGELTQKQAAALGYRIPRGTSVGRSGVPGNIPVNPEDLLRTDPRDLEGGPYGLISQSGGGGRSRGGGGGGRGGGRRGGRRSELDQEQMPATGYAAADTGTMTDAGPDVLPATSRPAQYTEPGAAPGYGSFTPGQAGGATNTILPTRPGSMQAAPAPAPAQAPTQTRAQERAANEKIAADRANRVYSDGRPYSAADKAAADRGDQVNANREEYHRRLSAGEPTGIDTGYGRGIDYKGTYDFSRPLPPRQAPNAQSMAERDEAVRMNIIHAPPSTAPMTAIQQKAAEASSKAQTEVQKQLFETYRKTLDTGGTLSPAEREAYQLLLQKYGVRGPPAASAAPAQGGAAAPAGITKTINGVTYRNDGRGWIAQ